MRRAADAPPTYQPTTAPAASETVVFSVDESVTCELGGSVAIEGEVTVGTDDGTDEGTGGGRYEHRLVQAHDGCTIPSNRLDEPFVVDGDPSITGVVVATMDGNGGIGAFQGSETGSIRWRLGSRSGRCTIAIAHGAVATSPTDYRITGSACGHTLDELLDVGG